MKHTINLFKIDPVRKADSKLRSNIAWKILTLEIVS